MHRHKYNELLFVLQGKIKFLVEDSIYQSNGSCIIIFKERRLHTTEVDSSQVYERYNIAFKYRYISDVVDFEGVRDCFENDCIIIPVNEEEKKELLGYFEPLFHLKEIEYSSKQDEMMKQHLLSVILLKVDRILKGHIDTSEYVMETYIADVLKYISSNLEKKLVIQDVSDLFFVSRVKLINDFKNVTGITIGDYIVTQRLKLSKELLLTGASVNETAVRSGFVNSCHFIRTFKKYNKITPLQYYKNKMKNKI